MLVLKPIPDPVVRCEFQSSMPYGFLLGSSQLTSARSLSRFKRLFELYLKRLRS